MVLGTKPKYRAFADVVVVITGGSSGIGKQIARELGAQRAHVVICSNTPDRLTETRAELEQEGLRIDIRPCDVRDSKQVKDLAAHVIAVYGRADILINNAGYAVYRAFEESSTDEVVDIVDVNLSGAMRCAKAFLPSMIEKRTGRIVNVSSIGGDLVITPNAAYCAAKHGMVAWSRAIRYELAPFGIGVNVVCPDHVKTHFQDHPTFRRRDPYRKKAVSGLTPEAVARGILAAIRHDRAVTYVPAWAGLAAWASHAAPFLVGPVWDRIMARRVSQLYEQIAVERRPPAKSETKSGNRGSVTV
jgi:short-subunit dehydrogenase